MSSARFAFLLGVTVLCALSGDAAADGLRYSVADLGNLGGTPIYGRAVNSQGWIAGEALTPSGSNHAFLYDGTFHDLGAAGYTESEAYGINDQGEVVGQLHVGNGNAHAFLYSNGTMRDIDQFGTSVATGINNWGQVTGYGATASNAIHAFIYSSGIMQDIGTIGDDRYGSRGFGINDLGDVVGDSDLGGTFLYDGAMHSLPLQVASFGLLNARGDVVGTNLMLDGTRHVFLYRAGSAVDLGFTAEPFGINSSDQIVGRMGNGSFLYTGGAVYNLNELVSSGWNIGPASAINDRGQIVATASINGSDHLLLLTPTAAAPLPPALYCGLFLLGTSALLRRMHVFHLWRDGKGSRHEVRGRAWPGTSEAMSNVGRLISSDAFSVKIVRPSPYSDEHWAG